MKWMLMLLVAATACAPHVDVLHYDRITAVYIHDPYEYSALQRQPDGSLTLLKFLGIDEIEIYDSVPQDQPMRATLTSSGTGWQKLELYIHPKAITQEAASGGE